MEPEERLDALLDDLAAHDRRESEGAVRRLWPEGWRPVRATQSFARHPIRLAAALAAALIIGVILGRWSHEPSAGAPRAASVPDLQQAPPASGLPEALSTAPPWSPVSEVRDRGTVLLVQVRESPGLPEGVEGAARDLLWVTRRLLDEPGGLGGEQRALLGELEWVLVQLTELDPESPPADVAATRASIESRDLIDRLHRLEAGKGASE